MRVMQEKKWLIISAHGAIFFHLLHYPKVTMRELADTNGLSERGVGVILSDLRKVGFIRSRKEGRANVYEVNPDGQVRWPLFEHLTIKEMMQQSSDLLQKTASW